MDEPRVPEGLILAGVIIIGLMVCAGLTVLCFMWLDKV